MKQGYNGNKGDTGGNKKVFFLILIYRRRLQGNIVFRSLFSLFFFTLVSLTTTTLHFGPSLLFKPYTIFFILLAGRVFVFLFYFPHNIKSLDGGRRGGGGGGE